MLMNMLCLVLGSLPLQTTNPGEFSTLPSDFALDQNYPQNILINNRILLKINGKAVTVMDVVRKMDLLFYRQYPELSASTIARYQFYSNSWRAILAAVIDDYLIVSDAEEKEVVINDGEVREELVRLFGHDVVQSVDELGMTLQEAFDLLKTELTVQRMTSMMVRSKSMTEVHPILVKKKYQEFLEQHPAKKFWNYQILSFRGSNHEAAAQQAYELIKEQQIPFQEVAAQIPHEGIEIRYSPEYRQHEGEISCAYREVLEGLSLEMASLPHSNKNVSRLFCLKKIEVEAPPSFHDFEDQLTRELSTEAFERYNKEYRDKLRHHYGLTDKYLSQIIPDDLQPFTLR